MHDEGGQGRKSVATEDVVYRVDEAVKKNRRFTLSCETSFQPLLWKLKERLENFQEMLLLKLSM